jgi:hypothetical protein
MSPKRPVDDGDRAKNPEWVRACLDARTLPGKFRRTNEIFASGPNVTSVIAML